MAPRVDAVTTMVDMGLNIKNPRVHALAREAAMRTGRNQTSVIELALERLLDQLDEPESTARVDDILRDLDARLGEAERARLETDSLYDEDGIPA